MKKKTEFVLVSEDHLDIRLSVDEGQVIIYQGSADDVVVFCAKDVKAFAEALLELCDTDSPDTSLDEP